MLAMNIALIGATGKLGQAVAEKMTAAGISFKIIGRSEKKLRSLYPDKDYIIADNNDPEAIQTAIGNCKIIINCCYCGSTSNIITASHKDSHIISMGSTRRYTKFPDQYAKDVEKAEQTLRSSGRSWIQINPTMIYGKRGEVNVQIIAHYIKRFGIIPITNNGKALVQPVYIEDLAEIICYLAQHNEINGMAITVAGEDTVTYKELIKLIAKTINHKVHFINAPILLLRVLAAIALIIPGLPHIRQSQIQRQLEDKNFDISVMQKLIPIKQISLEEGLKRTFLKDI